MGSGDTTGAPGLVELLSMLPCDVLRDGIWFRLPQASRVAMRSACKALRDTCDMWMTCGVGVSLPYDAQLKMKKKHQQKVTGKGKANRKITGALQKLSLTGGEGEDEQDEVEDPLVSHLVRYMKRTGRLRALRFDAITHMPRGLAALRKLLKACPHAAAQLQEIELMSVHEHELVGVLEVLKQYLGLRHVLVQLSQSTALRKVAACMALHLPQLQTWGLDVYEVATEPEEDAGSTSNIDHAPSALAASSASAFVSVDVMLARLTKLRSQSTLRVPQLAMLATCTPLLIELGLPGLLLEAEAPANGAATQPPVLPNVHTLSMSGTPHVTSQQLALLLRVCPALTTVKLGSALAVQCCQDMAQLHDALRGLAACMRKGGAVSTVHTSQVSNAPTPLVHLDGVVLNARRLWNVGDVLAASGILDVAGGLGFTDVWADQWAALRGNGMLSARIAAHPPTLTTLVLDTPNYALEADTWAWLSQFPRLEHLIMVWAPLGDAGGLAKLMMGQWPSGPRVGKALRVTLVRHQHRRGPCEDEKQLKQLLEKAGPRLLALLHVIQ